MRLDVLTIFPDYLNPLREALLGKAIERGIISVGVHNLRDWAYDNHRSVDDTPFGGGPGMVMKPEVLGPALDSVAQEAGEDLPLLLVPTPAGKPFNQADAQEWAREEHVVFLCGRYEGIDQRVIENARARYRVREVSIGDYVLIGGEVAVLVMVEAMVRLIPGVLGNQSSYEEDSFSDGLLEAPAYTKPRVWRGLEVPEVLTSGNHRAIERWRRQESLKRTAAVRPDLLAHMELSPEDERLLHERAVFTELNVLISPDEYEVFAAKVAKRVRRKGVEVAEVFGEVLDLTCEPDNVLVAQYAAENDAPPLDPVYRLIINARSALTLKEVTRAVVSALPRNTYWYGSSYEGRGGQGVTAVCAWQAP